MDASDVDSIDLLRGLQLFHPHHTTYHEPISATPSLITYWSIDNAPVYNMWRPLLQSMWCCWYSFIIAYSVWSRHTKPEVVCPISTQRHFIARKLPLCTSGLKYNPSKTQRRRISMHDSYPYSECCIPYSDIGIGPIAPIIPLYSSVVTIGEYHWYIHLTRRGNVSRKCQSMSEVILANKL